MKTTEEKLTAVFKGKRLNGFTVNADGTIVSPRKNKVGSVHKDRLRIGIIIDGKNTTIDSAALVYETFSGKHVPAGLIGFIDGNFQNCAFENLFIREKFVRNTGSKKKIKKVALVEADTEVIEVNKITLFNKSNKIDFAQLQLNLLINYQIVSVTQKVHKGSVGNSSKNPYLDYILQRQDEKEVKDLPITTGETYLDLYRELDSIIPFMDKEGFKSLCVRYIEDLYSDGIILNNCSSFKDDVLRVNLFKASSIEMTFKIPENNFIGGILHLNTFRNTLKRISDTPITLPF